MSKPTQIQQNSPTPYAEIESVFELSERVLLQLISQLPEWRIKQSSNKLRLERTYYFDSKEQAIDFCDKILGLVKDKPHQPEILITKNVVTVRWLNSKTKGLQQTDFVCAAETDSLLG